jgi:hypothetical protein
MNFCPVLPDTIITLVLTVSVRKCGQINIIHQDKNLIELKLTLGKTATFLPNYRKDLAKRQLLTVHCYLSLSTHIHYPNFSKDNLF